MNDEKSQYTQEQKQKGNNKILGIVIVILVLFIVALLAFIFINNSKSKTAKNSNVNSENKEEINKDDSSKNNVNNSSNDVIFEDLDYTPKCNNTLLDGQTILYTANFEASKYNNIVEYLKEQKNLTVTLKHYYLTENNESKNIDKVLSDDEVNNMFKEMSPSIVKIGGIGFVSGPILYINYTKGDKQLYVSFTQLQVIDTNDGDLLRIMDNSIADDNDFCNYGIGVDSIGSTVKNIDQSLLSQIKN